jgi:hypothetical protein
MSTSASLFRTGGRYSPGFDELLEIFNFITDASWRNADEGRSGLAQPHCLKRALAATEHLGSLALVNKLVLSHVDTILRS